MKTTKHTPPWRNVGPYVVNDQGYTVADCSGCLDQTCADAMARFIVKACGQHFELVSLVKKLKREVKAAERRGFKLGRKDGWDACHESHTEGTERDGIL